MPLELWTWLRESRSVRPHVVARVRAGLASGERVTPDAVARAMMTEPFRTLASRPYTAEVAHGSVVASRCQSQAKRPT